MRENVKIQGQLRFYLQWPVILSVFLMAANLVVGAVSPKAGIVMSGFTLIYILIALWLMLYRRKRLLGGLVEFSAEYASIQKQLIYDMATPYAIAGEDGHLIWMNKAFSAATREEKGCRKNLSALFPEVTRELLDDMEDQGCIHSSYDGKFYQIDIRRICMDEAEGLKLGMSRDSLQECLLAVYLFDETEVIFYKQEIDKQKLDVYKRQADR